MAASRAPQHSSPRWRTHARPKVDAIGAGNHEFDTGFTDLSERIIPRMGVPHLSANVYTKGTTTVAAPLKEYEVFTKAGVRIAVVGAVTGDLVQGLGITQADAEQLKEAYGCAYEPMVDSEQLIAMPASATPRICSR